MAVVLWAALACAHAPSSASPWVWLTAASLLVLLSMRAPPHTARAAALLAVACAGLARGGASARLSSQAEAWLREEGRLARIRAVIDEPPRREGGEPVAAVRVIAADPAMADGTRLSLRWPAGTAGEWGDTLAALVRLDPAASPRVPGGFDARAAARAQRIAGRARALHVRVSPARGLAHAPVAAAMRVRRACERALARSLSPRAHEFAAPLLFGDRSAMTTEVDASLRASGLVHLLALSGLHVAWMAAVARGLAAIAGASARMRAIVGGACAVAYAMLAGPIASLWRASATELAAALASGSQRALDPVQALAAGSIALLLLHPGWAGDLGFQLSCAATLGLVTLTEPVSARLARWRLPPVLRTPLAATAAAQAAALPILIIRFHALPWTGLAANLVAVPIAELLLAGAWLGALADLVVPGLGRVWFAACEPLAWALRTVSGRAAELPLALLPCGEGRWAAGAAAAGVLLLMLALAPSRVAVPRRGAAGRAPLAAAGGLALALALLAVAVEPPRRPAEGRWWLVVLDVGQGDAIAVGTHDGWWLIDAGARSPQWDAGEGVVLPFLRWAGVRRLEGLVLTHDDSDHTGGAAATRRGVRVPHTYAPAARPGVPGPGARYRARPVARGDVLRARAPRLTVLWPPRPGEPGDSLARRGDNAASVAIRAGRGAASALLLADLDSLSEAALSVERTAIIKLGHHGSGSSTGAGTLERSRAARAVVSCGRRNRYGHPDPRVLARLAAFGLACDRTDRAGTLVYVCDDAGCAPLDWRGGAWTPERRRAAAGTASAARAY